MEEKFKEELKEALEIENREVNLSDNFRDYTEWDSLAQLTLIAMLDDRFGVSIEMPDFEKLITVDDLIREVQKRMSLVK
ncbi:MAG: acyl carrier protein [Ignavibacteria bacterium]|jgi:acyl carrier protein